MLQCEGGCQQMCEEYYRMPDGKIYCEKCWRHGREIADIAAIQRHNQILQVQRDKDIFEQKNKEDRIRLSQLEHAIQLEKSKCRTAWSDYESDYSGKPYNYEEVELLRRQHDDLERQLNSRVFKYPEKGPIPSNSYYFSKAQFISKSQAHYFETVTLPQEKEAARKSELERLEAAKKAELERLEAAKKADAEAKAKRQAEEATRKRAMQIEAEKERLRIIASKVSITMFKCRLRHNTVMNAQNGMQINVDFIINNALSQDVECSAYFCDENSKRLINPNGLYKSLDGQVSVGVHLGPTSQQYKYKDIKLFIPVSEFQIVKEKKKIQFYVCVFVNGLQVYSSEFYEFGYKSGKTFPIKHIAHKIAVGIIYIGIFILVIEFICIALGL